MSGKTHQGKTFDFFRSEFRKESERAKVILSASMLDEALFAVLQSKLVPIPSSSDSIFDGPNAPMSSFSSRIDFAYRLGLISKNLCRDLHIIRRIRNEFAHNVSGCNFEASNIANRVTTLKSSFSTLIKSLEKRVGEQLSHIKIFEEVVSVAIWHLWGLTEEIDSIVEGDAEWCYTHEINFTQDKSEQK